MRLILMLSLFSFLVVACGPLSPAYYQPTEPTYKYYKKAGATELDVKKAMLECGISDIDTSSGNFKQDMNSFLLADWCMEKSGFVGANGADMTMEEACQLEHNKQYPACQPDAVILKPSVERRLNSEYCKSAREMISEEKYQRCMQVEAVQYKEVTEKDCAYWHRELVEECRP
jgi:predicted nucleic acid-binding Zn ribbon protein